MKISGMKAIGLAAAGLLLLGGCKDLKPVRGKGKAAKRASSAKGPKVKVEMYVMSKCPYGSQAEAGITPVIEKLGDHIDFQLDFIGDEKEDGTLTAMHGEPEVKGNIVQLCAIKHHPDARTYMKFIACQNKNFSAIPEGWEDCAKEVGLDLGKMKKCVDGAEGKDLLRASYKRARARGANGSPTIYIADTPYNGDRSADDFMRQICGQMEGERPKACADIPKLPPPVEVTVTVLTDSRCKKCEVDGLAANLRQRFFPKLTVKKVDYMTPEGKELYAKVGAKLLPIWLFSTNVEKSRNYDRIARWMEDKAGYKMLRVPANFDPTAEICDNNKDDTGNGKVDCDDPQCKNAMECREEKKNSVQVFVMSQCPYGVQAVNAMKEVFANFKGKIDFDIHYIADETSPGEFSALHGPPEVAENIRQLCAKKYYRKDYKYLDYIWCRNKNYRDDNWKPCAKEAGLDVAKIEKCATGEEGKKLHSEDIKIAKALDISGSPTWLANNRYKFSGITADAIKSNICQRNPDLPNCDKKLNDQAAAEGSCN